MPAQCPGMGQQQSSTVSGGVGGSGVGTTPGAPSTPAPGAPAGPGPSGPGTPDSGPHSPGAGPAASPSGPTTPPPAAAVAARSGPTTARGLALTFERGTTSKERLKIEWRHPVPPASKDTHTAAAGALPLTEALDVLWENDERPLLVLRECNMCQDSDQALLSRSLNNDRTMLMTKWFRVVRLPAHVTEPTHPFHNVFAGFSFPSAPHFFLLADKNSKPVSFTGMQTPSILQKSMLTVLRERYTKDADKAVKQWLACLDQFDRFDASMRQLQEELDATRAKDGPDSARAKELYKRLDEVRQQRGEALAREERIRDLGLSPMAQAAAPAAGGSVAVK